MSLVYLDDGIIHMDPGSFMWVQTIRFKISRDDDDQSLLRCLIATPWYCHDYASPFDPDREVVEPAVHGRWWRSSISPELFEPCDASDAETVLTDWAENHDWGGGYRPSQDALQQLQVTFSVFHSGSLYQLHNPGPEHVHDYGWVTGGMGFHEFVVIDRDSLLLHLMVASDD